MFRSWTLGFYSLCLTLVVACGGRTPLSGYEDGGPPDPTCDLDHDGYLGAACDGDDCNDRDRAVHPGAAERCFDGQDNDCNGAVDCDDRSCAGIPECGGSCVPTRERCSDGADNDCDGLFDCADPDCAGDPACGPCLPGPEFDCFNGIDDDCNGARDCEDPACRPQPECGGMCTPGPEFDCFNGIDDDCNGLPDCEDPSCAMFPECGSCRPSPELCFNGIDDDCNGAFDCDDPACAMQPACGMCVPSPERCGNGIDDDCDGAPDCADTECVGTTACGGRTCPTANLGSRLGDALATGSTVGARNDFRGGCGDDGPERTFRWRAPHDGAFLFDTAGSGFDTVLYLMRDCAGSTIPGACNDDAGTTQAQLTWRVAAGESVIVVVDGFGGDAGPFVLSIREAPGMESGPLCFNGLDDDGDGRFDCDDLDCAAEPGCGGCMPRPEICDNRRDDDCDGAPDCADPDCSSDPACGSTMDRELGVAACTNGRDDDGDGRIDCEDPDCSPFGTSPDNECCNGLDDNGDGQIDEFTCRCFNDSQCAGVGTLEQTCWTSTFHVCGARCDFYGGDGLCTEFFGPDWRCIGTQCAPPMTGPPPPVPGG